MDTLPAATPRKWTVLAYVSGDNNLEPHAVNALLQLERVGSSEDVDFVVQMDRRTIPEEFSDHRLGVDGDWDTARRFHVERGMARPSVVESDTTGPEPQISLTFLADRFASPAIAELGEVDMAASRELQGFLEWGMQAYPAEHYMLLMVDHGHGWLGSMLDESSDGILPVPQMRDAIRAAEEKVGQKLDVVGFDACCMATVETAYELRDVADVLVASEQYEIAPGWPLAEVARRLVEGNRHGVMSAKEVGRAIVDEASRSPVTIRTMSAVDTRALEPVKQAVDRLALDLMAPGISPYFAHRAIEGATHFEDGLMGDLVDIDCMARSLASRPEISNSELRQHAHQLSARAHEAVLAETHSGPDVEAVCGLSIYAPTMARNFDRFRRTHPITMSAEPEERFSYRRLDFARDNRWEEMLREKFRKVG